jgi:hypothetical protein
MNNAKEKAKELVNIFRPHSKYWDCRNDEPLEENHAKQCALIAVDEILKSVSVNKVLYLTDMTYQIYTYWSKVKDELEKL